MDEAAIEDAARQNRLTAQRIDAIRQAHPIHWERMLLKRELRLAHYQKHGWVPEGVTPGWPLGRHFGSDRREVVADEDAPNPRNNARQAPTGTSSTFLTASRPSR